jgi:VWFA-related protein
VAVLACAAAGTLRGGPDARAAQAPPPASPAPSASAGPPAAGAATPPVPVFTSDVDVIAVDVNVVDKEGRPIRGLGIEDFKITVDGNARRVVSADFVSQSMEEPAEPTPSPAPDRTFSTNEGVRRGRIIVIAVDQGNIRPGAGRHALRAADRLLDALNPQDQVALVTMPGGGPQVDLTTEHTRVRAALKRITGRAQYAGHHMSLSEAQGFDEHRSYDTDRVIERECPASMNQHEREMCISDVEGEAFSVMANFRQQSLVSLKSLALLMQSLLQIEGPKTVVLITEGLRAEQSDDIRQIANAAAMARVAFFGIHIDESGMPDPSLDRAPSTPLEDQDLTTRDLYRLSSLTRGAVFRTVGSSTPFERIAREISGYYLLGFEPQGTDRNGKDHVIDVKVPRPGVTVRARRALPLAAPRDQRDILAATLRNPLPAIELPLRVTTYASRDAASGKVRVVVSGEIGRGGTSPAGMAVGFALLDDKGKVAGSSFQRVPDDAAPRSDGPVPYLGAAMVEPGHYTLKLAAVDARGRRGSVQHPVRAALTAVGPVEVSDLILAEPASGPGAVLRPGVDVAIDAGAVVGLVELHAQDADVLKTATVMLEIAAEESGPALVSAPARLSAATGAERSAQGAVSLALIPPGRYVGRAVVSVSGKPMGQVTRPLTVAPTRAGSTAGRLAFSPFAAPRFDRHVVLEPQVVVSALDDLAAGAAPASPAVSRAAAEARQGRLEALVDLLREGEAPSASLAFLRGLGFFARGEMVPAADQFRTALRLRPDFAAATLYLGAASAALGRDQDAAGAWNTAMLEDARSPVLSLLLGDALLRQGEVDSAVDVLREAAAAWPTDDRFPQRLGVAYGLAGRSEDALPLLSAHLDRHPEDIDTLFATVRLLYEGQAGAGGDRERLLRYARAYVAAAGPHQALVATWIKAVEAKR